VRVAVLVVVRVVMSVVRILAGLKCIRGEYLKYTGVDAEFTAAA
jgi:hypothetical protein